MKDTMKNNDKKTILIITDNLKTQINGVVTTFKNIEICAGRDGYDIVYLDPGQFSHANAPGYPEVKLSWPQGIGKKIEAVGADHVHIATEGPIGLAARCWLDSRGWLYNTSYHTKFPELLKKIYGAPLCITYRYVRWFHKHSGRVLTTTRTMVEDLESQGFNGDIIPWTRGVNCEIFNTSQRNREDDRTVLVCVSRISKEKNLDDFCKLDYPKSRKIMVGDGPDRARLEKLYPDVEFVGFKTGLELAYYYANADVFVFPSRWETFGIVMIEAMACGTPVAAYNCQGPKDVIDQGVTGFMVEAHEGLGMAVDKCLKIDRANVHRASQRWSWQRAWEIFRDNLI
jgi:glycosyltransferase involved in cell wall biosynthesis